MRHLAKPKGVSVARLHQICSTPDVQLRCITVTLMAADIFTKAFSDKMKWAYLCKLGGLFEAGPDAGTWSEAAVAEKTLEHSMRVLQVGTRRPGGLGETLLPDRFPAECKSYGWHS